MGAGRPLIYKTPEEMQRIIDLYFMACKINREDDFLPSNLSDEDLLVINQVEDDIPTVSGLAYTLGMSTEALRNYGEKDKFLATVKRAKQRVERTLERRLYEGSPVGAIFNLKNNFGWKDKTESDITSGGKPIQNEWHIHPVTHAKDKS